MWGAVIGDTVGSRFEFGSFRSTRFEFFGPGCHFTDDTVCTAAVADMLMNGHDPAAAMQAWCRRYPTCSWGGRFGRWIHEETPAPYGSYGNGAAMRVSPAAFLTRHRPLADALAAADRVTGITHDHPEGMKGARATTHAIWLAFQGETPESIATAIATTYGYDLSRDVATIRETYEYNETCQRTVPEALVCALEAADFEQAVRNAVSLGGDADTLAAIAGSVAEPLHGIPPGFISFVENETLRDAPDIRDVLRAMYA
ncbi:MAG: ADP-ribosylglycohydrolase family protein [Acidobacteria bacterium]|nr:ADP-ribosylglycohydrolase family protein [Acidobacteriota bacterium]MYG76113.1 ADP-ribosylglycohydrolase family protein [Acidobacteriota bacterium]